MQTLLSSLGRGELDNELLSSKTRFSMETVSPFIRRLLRTIGKTRVLWFSSCLIFRAHNANFITSCCSLSVEGLKVMLKGQIEEVPNCRFSGVVQC